MGNRLVARAWPPLREALARGTRSPLVPFELRCRIRWRRQQGTWIARRPELFTEKVRWKMLKDRRPLVRTFADRVAAREYVARVAGDEWLPECHAIVDDPSLLRREALPRQFVAKTTHGSGAAWIVSDSAPDGTTVEGEWLDAPHRSLGSCWNHVLTRPDAVDWELFRSTLRGWLALDFAHRYLEWCYLDIPRRIVVEELLRTADGKLPVDYRFFVFHGQTRFVQINAGRFEEKHRGLYLPDWTVVEAPLAVPRIPHTAPPEALAQMLELSALLGRETDFVRVDLYDVDGRVVFGELTNYPGPITGGPMPAALDRELGGWWTLPRRYG